MLLATTLALASACLHAAWNVAVKTAEERDLASWGQYLAGALLTVPALVVLGLPAAESLPYLAASAVIHVAYVTGLVAAYHHGDFSLAYPIARGGGAVLAAVGGAVLLGDALGPGPWIGIAIAGVGLVGLAGRRADAASVGWALFTAACIAAYTLVDARGARVAGDGVRYGFALMPAAAVTLTVNGVLRRRGRAFVAGLRDHWHRHLLAGVLLCGAYTMVLVAVNHAPVGHVAMLRESSVVIAALVGWKLLDEPMGHRRLALSAVVLVGLVVLVATG